MYAIIFLMTMIHFNIFSRILFKYISEALCYRINIEKSVVYKKIHIITITFSYFLNLAEFILRRTDVVILYSTVVFLESILFAYKYRKMCCKIMFIIDVINLFFSTGIICFL